MVFMLSTNVMHAKYQNVRGIVLEICTSASNRFSTCFGLVISDYVHTLFGTSISKNMSMHKLRKRNFFSYIPETNNAVENTFQQSIRPSGWIKKEKLYFSSNYKLYGVIFEVAVLPYEFFFSTNKHYRGFVYDFHTFQRSEKLIWIAHEKWLSFCFSRCRSSPRAFHDKLDDFVLVRISGCAENFSYNSSGKKGLREKICLCLMRHTISMFQVVKFWMGALLIAFLVYGKFMIQSADDL